MVKRLAIVLAMILSLSFIARAEDITIAVVPKALDNPVFEPAKQAAEEEAKKLGVRLLWTGPAETDTEAQIVALQQLIDSGVDGLAISCNDAEALNDVIAEAVNKGIVVSTWDSDAPNSERQLYIGTDNYAGGVKCGKAMAELIGPNKKIFALSGSPEAFNLNERVRGFEDGVGDANITIEKTLYCYDSVDDSAALIEGYLKNNPDIDGLYIAGGWPLFAPAKDMTNLKKFQGGVVCFDYFPQGKAFVTDGLIDTCVAQDFANMGRLSVRYLADIIRNGADYPEINDSGLFVVDSTNIDQN